VFLIDDLVLRSVGITIPGLDLIWTFEQIRKFAYREMYNPTKIKNAIKENRLLYEFGEISREEYEQSNAELMRKLRLAERALEMDLGSRVDILGGGLL
jgi:hypothetical protein